MITINTINDLRLNEQEHHYENLRREADEWRLLRPIYAAKRAQQQAALRMRFQRLTCQLQDLLGLRAPKGQSACNELSAFDTQTRRDVATLS